MAALVRGAAKGRRALRRALGVEVRIGDYNEYASLLSAFRRVDKLFFVSSNDISEPHSPTNKRSERRCRKPA